MVEHPLGDLLTFGLAYEAYMRAPVNERGDLALPTETLTQFLRAANELIAAQIKQIQIKKTKKQTSGRPPESSMGDQVARYVANGMAEDTAMKMVAASAGKSLEAVRRSYQAACKKPA